jgi:hypothetical protein
VGLFQPFGIKAEFFGHLDELLRGLRILDGAGQSLGSDGLVAIVICLGHVGTFLDRYKLRQKGSITTMRTPIGGLRGQIRRAAAGAATSRRTDRSPSRGACESNAILSAGGTKKSAPCSFSGEQKESRFAVFGTVLVGSRSLSFRATSPTPDANGTVACGSLRSKRWKPHKKMP